MLGLNNIHDVKDWIISHQNKDGGYGLNKSDIDSTFYAVHSLNCINPSLIKNKSLIIDFINQCQTIDGGYTFIPEIYPPYIEPTYSGIKTLEILGSKPNNKNKIIHFIGNLQNDNGGFRRSKYMGISELEYTFKGLCILKNLSYHEK
ncbi:MAG: hypothetical protein LLF83_04295 [Methanobacterium sp.]|nr:hypothetical protein [Methanobacterium sp.]